MREERDGNPAFREGAASYDGKHQKIAPIRESLNLLTRILMLELADDANVLCVGAGTGSELLYLADAFPNMRFTAVDPAPAMLNICRKRATEAGIASRCTFHDGSLDTLPDGPRFAAATSLLVSHFITGLQDRKTFYGEIRSRLSANGLYVNATLAMGAETQVASDQKRAWFDMQAFSGLGPGEVQKMRSAVGTEIVVLRTSEVESEIASAGFSVPVPFMQGLLIHGWYARCGQGHQVNWHSEST